MNDLKEKATNLLHILWRGVPRDYKSRYRRNIWQQFEDQVRSAAYTSNLARFTNVLCQKLQVVVRQKDAEVLEQILSSGEDKVLLKLMRQETTLLVLRVRLRQQEAREKYLDEAEQEQQLMDAMKEAKDSGQLPI